MVEAGRLEVALELEGLGLALGGCGLVGDCGVGLGLEIVACAWSGEVIGHINSSMGVNSCCEGGGCDWEVAIGNWEMGNGRWEM